MKETQALAFEFIDCENGFIAEASFVEFQSKIQYDLYIYKQGCRKQKILLLYRKSDDTYKKAYEEIDAALEDEQAYISLWNKWEGKRRAIRLRNGLYKLFRCSTLKTEVQ